MSKRVCPSVCFAVILFSTTLVFVEGLPILGPDLNTCMPVLPFGRPLAEPVDCCFVDTSRPIKDFKFNLDLPVRVRKPAHTLDDESVRKYERAVELMKALPPEDPRSFEAQSKIHCAYCSGAYNQRNTTLQMTVHFGWLFFPFHRWFLYFYERILARLIGDDTFAIPFWAWDIQNEHSPSGNSIPPIYTNKNSSLYDENRSKSHQPPHRVDLKYDVANSGNRDEDVVMQDNYYAMWQSMISQVRTPEAFYGGSFSQGDDVLASHPGNFESGPHASVHHWTGDYANLYGEDMGPSHTAARDPLFFGHHSQVDRLWVMWKSWGGKDLNDTDWLDTEYLLYDENADMVRVKVRDALNFSNFRVTYEHLEPDWVKYTPKSIRETHPKYARASTLRRFWQVVSSGIYGNIAMFRRIVFQKGTNNWVQLSLEGVRRDTVTSRVSRPVALRSKEDSSVYDELLVIRVFVEKPFDVSVLIKVFLELPEADEDTPQHCVEFLGDLKVDAEAIGVAGKLSRTFSIRDSVQILGITHQKSVTVTFVPAWDPKHDPDVSVRVTDLKVEMRRER